MDTREPAQLYDGALGRAAARGVARARMLRRVYRMLFQDYESQVRLGKGPDLSHVIPDLDP